MIRVLLAALISLGIVMPALASGWECINVPLTDQDCEYIRYFAKLRDHYGYVLTDESLFNRVAWDLKLALAMATVQGVVDDWYTKQVIAHPQVAPDLVP